MRKRSCETPPSLEFLREQVGLVISYYQKKHTDGILLLRETYS